jgi:DNA ligase-1
VGGEVGGRLADLVRASRDVAATRARGAKVQRLAEALRSLPPRESAVAACWLGGELRQDRVGVGPALVRHAREQPPASRPSLGIAEVDSTLSGLTGLSGPGSQSLRRQALESLFARASADEQRFLARLLLGELRQGAVAGLALEAIAATVAVPPKVVRRAAMLSGDLARVAAVAFEQGPAGLRAISLDLFVPVAPMLAQPAEDLDDAVGRLADPFLEYKLDGARVQVHKRDELVRVYSRQGNAVTDAVPEVVDAVAALPAANLVLDGEVLALRPDGSPLPFQTTMRRFGRRLGVAAMRGALPLRVFFFDCLHADGETLIDAPATQRFAALADAVPGELLIPRCRPASAAEAQTFLERALALGHEGLMAKDPTSPYQAGGRGGHWLKVKQTHTLDLVVLAAEWGSGRRVRWLSNLHLGARDPAGGFVMLGKTFKGLTDDLLAWQTEQLLARAVARDGHVVHVDPSLVVEIAFNELQESPHYPGGLALRFARVKRYRSDKSAAEADTIDTVRALFARQVAYRPSAFAAD